MELSLPVILRIFIAIGLIIPIVLGLFSISLRVRISIAAAMVVGTILLGIGAWSLIRPPDPLGAVTVLTGGISFVDTIICVILSFAAGLLAYFASFPYGRQIGPIAAPTGLAVWGILSGDMTSLIGVNHTLAQRQNLYAILKWEGFLWLIIIAAGYYGVIIAERLSKAKQTRPKTEKAHNSRLNKALNIATALIVTTVIAQFGINIFAQDVRMLDSKLGSIVGQPEVGQIAFAVLLSFGITGFITKKFLDADYTLGAVAAAISTAVAVIISAKTDVLTHMVNTWPVAFFPRATSAVLPLQFIAFGALGSIAGYWIAVKYTTWRKQSH